MKLMGESSYQMSARVSTQEGWRDCSGLAVGATPTLDSPSSSSRGLERDDGGGPSAGGGAYVSLLRIVSAVLSSRSS